MTALEITAGAEEIWHPVPNEPWAASSWGRVCRTTYRGVGPRPRPTYGIPVPQKRDGREVYRVMMVREGSRKTKHPPRAWSVHRLVARAFHGEAPSPQAVVLHLNDDPTDNRPENLSWGTQRENLNTERFRALCRERGRSRDMSKVARARWSKQHAE